MGHININTKISRRDFIKKALFAGGGVGLAGLALYLRSGQFEPNYLDVTTLDLTLSRLSPRFEGFKIVHLSDIHFDQPMLKGFFIRLVKLVNRLRPDLIVITGDFLGGTSPYHSLSLEAGLRLLDDHPVKLAILGNHDHFVNPYVVSGLIRNAGFILLRNEIFTIRKDGALLHIVVIDDVLWKKDNLDRVLNRLPQMGEAILLVHEPDFADQIPFPSRFDLQLSGHSHGGQIVIPGIGPLFKPEMGVKYISGLYTLDSMQVYTNRGLGQVSPHFRLNALPEVTFIRLHAKQLLF